MSLRLARVFALLLAISSASLCAAQETGGEGGPDRSAFAGMQRESGIITAVAADKLTIKTDDGTVYGIVTTPNTRFMRNSGPIKITDLKPGDGVMSMGNLDAPNKTLHAAMVISIDAEQVKKATAARAQFIANLGKTVIAGRVTAIDIDNAKMTIDRVDHVVQTISFDESTSFRRAAPGRMGAGEANGMGFGGMYAGMGGGRGAAANATADAGESITLADIKVGDNVNGPGAVKGGSFVPTQLTVRTPRPRGERRGPGQGPMLEPPASGTKPQGN